MFSISSLYDLGPTRKIKSEFTYRFFTNVLYCYLHELNKFHTDELYLVILTFFAHYKIGNSGKTIEKLKMSSL